MDGLFEVKLWSALAIESQTRILKRSGLDIDAVSGVVADIIKKVRNSGDQALSRYNIETEGLTGPEKPLLASPQEFIEAKKKLPDSIKKAIDLSIKHVRAFHERQIPAQEQSRQLSPGLWVREEVRPLDSVGLYVPGGRGRFPSMLYMLAVPARLAGVSEITICTPPASSGEIDPACLYAAEICGAQRVCRLGGAAAIAALALGTESVPKVAKIVGPGSKYVAAAKKQLADKVDIGLPAGPSEAIIVADDSADPRKTALDLLTEAEHGEDSAALLLTDSRELAWETAVWATKTHACLPPFSQKRIERVFSDSGYGGIFVFSDLKAAIDLVNRYAPEHLQVRTRCPDRWLDQINNAGEILVGEHTPFGLANYGAGPNAVLPTGGGAVVYSGVSVRDFIKHRAIIRAEQSALEALAGPLADLAVYENFPTHALALKRGQ